MRGTKAQTAPGVWRLRVYIGAKPNGQPIQASRTFRGGARAADDELRRFVDQVGRSRSPERNATLGRLLEAWMANRRNATPLTLQADQGYIDGRIAKALGHIRLDKLNARDLDRAYTDWIRDGLSPSTVNKLHSIISAALTQATKWDWADRNVAKLASPPSRKSGAVDRSIAPAELTLMIQAARAAGDDTLAVAITLGAVTGCRRGELLALRWSDVDFDRGSLLVARSVSKPAGAPLGTGATKTRNSRTLSLDAGTVALLEWWQDRQKADAARDATKLARNPYILADPSRSECDQPVLPQTLSKQFMKLARRLKMPYHLHELRHFAATAMISSGIDPRMASTRLGHAKTQITLDLYAHAVESADRRAADLLGALMPALPG